MTPFEALTAAMKKAGSQSALARICGCSQTAVWKMAQSSKRLSTGYVLAVEAATGISRHDLRPDIYPRPSKTQPKRRADDEDLTPWDTGVYDNQTDILDLTHGATI
ncbi:MAG: YdaS family helix-turn-helix protein [Asticcacaulis sp.]